MKNINLRGIDDTIMRHLKSEALQQNISVNTLILKLIQQGLGLSHTYQLPIYHDLDKLAGTWTESEAIEFNRRIAAGRIIDEEMWK